VRLWESIETRLSGIQLQLEVRQRLLEDPDSMFGLVV
jgi:hypothetical protein